ncbi:MAG: haloalkane dehalogenase [Phenylobacterium sp.]|uniref:haloalkane dehalogenase n=1 Tax=Phenylobacterium sp. TaxID=1871053 RepID=UPI002725747C|nr:haloalkane dehalogenase [Phenylobacterium sp.]MDO8911854.1 haloalkane dehalogenase [Phenylobacterium sp.]MDP3102268.1 haloalkane dehalogenase [Phenylobacterium sp.]
MQVLRTPDDRFAGLADWPYAPHYAQVMDSDGTALRLAYVDEGPRDGAVVLLMHGEPSWAYLYRKIIAALVAKGHRVIAPDLIGFGRSDKPAKRTDYTYARHVAWMSQWFSGVDLKHVTLFCQDWGGLIGLRLAAAFPERFAGLVIANTGLPTGAGMTDGFKAWLEFSQTVPEMPIGMIVNMGTGRELTLAEIAAYDAPFPDETYKEGARQFPTLVPVTPEHGQVAENKAAWEVLERFDRPVITAFSDGDAVSRGGDAVFQARIPGAAGQSHVTTKGGHFLQEDCPDDITAIIDTLIRTRS